MLRNSLLEYVEHYHLERNHQGLDNQIILPLPIRGQSNGRIHRRSRLGGVLNCYQRLAA
jgi:putative transposase